MANITVQKLNKQFNQTKVLDDFNLESHDGEFVVFVGPSGCGKTTTMRIIAGLETVTSGKILLGGRDITNDEPKDRDIAMVFQNYALYPHMSIFKNIAFGLRMRKIPKLEISKRVQEVAEILNIENLLDRKPGALSGGQRQRVALGRAIIREPKLFLMDEPLSNLDASLRVTMRSEISKLHARLGVTTIYVTHDQVEAMTMGSRIVVMREGVIQQVGTPDDIYKAPENRFVARFIGSPPMNLIQVKLNRNSKTVVSGEDVTAKPSEEAFNRAAQDGEGEVWLGVRPENLFMLSDSPSDSSHPSLELHGRVALIENLGSRLIVQLNVGDEIFSTELDPESGISLNDHIRLGADQSKLYFFSTQTEKCL